jgi:acetyl esterase/lipase
MHGGGFVVGSNDMDDGDFDRWCPQLGVVGVSVEYRLAPETPYPGPLEDCYNVLRWTHRHADELGVDASRIGVRSVRAGGDLATPTALLARDRGDFPVSFQLLEMPMLDDRQITQSSQQENLPVGSASSNEFGWRSCLGDLYGSSEIPTYAAPARAADLVGLPAALIVVGTSRWFSR